MHFKTLPISEIIIIMNHIGETL